MRLRNFHILQALCLAWVAQLRAFSAEPTAGGQDLSERIRFSLAPLAELVEQDPSGGLAQTHLNRQRLPQDVIMPYFYGVKGALHEHSPGRQQRVENVEQWLEPFAQVLCEVTRASAQSSETPNASAQLLEFVRASPEVAAALLAIARDPQARPNKAADAYDVVFKLQLDDATVRSEVVAKIGWRDERSTRATLGAGLLRDAAIRWAMPELEPLWIEFLSVPCVPENYPTYGGRQRLIGNYLLAAKALSRLGILARAHLDLCSSRIMELDPAVGYERDLIAELQQCIERLNGERVPELAVNFKGQLLGVSARAYEAWKNATTTDSVLGDGATAPAPTASPPPAAAPAAAPAPNRETNWWLWSAAGVAVLSAIILLARARR